MSDIHIPKDKYMITDDIERQIDPNWDCSFVQLTVVLIKSQQ